MHRTIHFLQLALITFLSLVATTATAETFRLYPDSPFKICFSEQHIIETVVATFAESYAAAEAGVRLMAGNNKPCAVKSGLTSTGDVVVLDREKINGPLGYNEVVYIKVTRCNTGTSGICYMALARNMFGIYEDLPNAVLVSRRLGGIDGWLKSLQSK